jgi:hypothetical protein
LLRNVLVGVQDRQSGDGNGMSLEYAVDGKRGSHHSSDGGIVIIRVIMRWMV